MTNPLTGDYEAVLEIAIRQINGILGTFHQNAALPDVPLKLLHSATLRIGDPRRRPPDVSAFGDWVGDHQVARSGIMLPELRAELMSGAPPGAAQMLADAFPRLYDVIDLPRDVVRGTVKVQVSSVTITVPDGSSSEITVHARIRAHYYPDSGTTDLPSPIHGEVRAAFDVRKVQSGSGTRLLIRPSSDDAKIQFMAFMAGTGLTAADESRLSVELRKALRESLTLVPVDLSSGFPFADFKGLGSGPNEVIALPFQLSGAGPPASGVQGLTQSFIGSSGFALAVAEEYLTDLIDVEAIRNAINGRSVVFRVDLLLGSVSVRYRLRFSSGPTLTFRTGGIEISGRIEVETSHPVAPNGFVSFRQLVTLVLDTITELVRPQRVGDPDVDESWFIPHGEAVNTVRTEIENALSANELAVRDVFRDGKNRLLAGLLRFDADARPHYTAIEITPNGVIVRGEIISAARRAPVVHIAETHQAEFTSFQSWIPAGGIDRFIWSWVEYLDFRIWSGVERSFTDVHRFIFPKPAGVTEVSQICLRIEGTRILPDGQEASIAAGTTCQVPRPEFAIDIPSWWEPLTLPIWRPGLDHGTSLKDGIAGHVSLQPAVPGKRPLSRNTLVYFADWSLERPLDRLSAALSEVRDGSSLMVIVVLPAGAFDSSRREVERRLQSSVERIRSLVQFTEDDEGGWTRIFAVGTKPSVYLMTAKGGIVWKHEGEADPATLTAAIDKHLVPTPAPPVRLLRLVVSVGDAAPDAVFADEDGSEFALHRLRGLDVLLNFWQSWSAPCLKELGRLERVHQAGRDRPFIVAFHGGKNSDALGEIRKRLGLSFPLVQDSQQRIARQYGVRCWPTTISVGADGRVEHAQFGIAHGT